MVLTVVGAALGYMTSVVAARYLGAGGFEDYAVSVASLGLLSTVAEAGTGKYALKAIPGYVSSRKWNLGPFEECLSGDTRKIAEFAAISGFKMDSYSSSGP